MLWSPTRCSLPYNCSWQWGCSGGAPSRRPWSPPSCGPWRCGGWVKDFGGVLTGGADPLTGAPGAVILYALAAVLLWPRVHNEQERSVGPPSVAAASPLGDLVARLLWLVLWGSLAYFAVQPANRAANGPHDAVAGLAWGEPAWLAGLDRTVSQFAGRCRSDVRGGLGRGSGDHRARRVCASTARPPHPDPRDAGRRRVLGHRRGLGWHLHWARHRPGPVGHC